MGVSEGQDVFVTSKTKDRFSESPALRAMEKNLFRYEVEPFLKEQDSIHLMEMPTPVQEVHQVGLAILELVRKKGLLYRDIALVCGDLESYAPLVEAEFAKMEIPCFLEELCSIP